MPSNESIQPIVHVCVRRDHFEIGLRRNDGTGHLTLVGKAWAYCAAARPTEEHVWQRITPVPFDALSHQTDWLARVPAEGRGD